MTRKVIMDVINIINMINDKWGPPGPGKAVWGLCRDHSGKLQMADCLYGANPAPKRGPLGSGRAAWEQGGTHNRYGVGGAGTSGPEK